MPTMTGADTLKACEDNAGSSEAVGRTPSTSRVGAGLDKVLDYRVTDGDHVQLDAGVAYTFSQVGAEGWIFSLPRVSLQPLRRRISEP